MTYWAYDISTVLLMVMIRYVQTLTRMQIKLNIRKSLEIANSRLLSISRPNRRRPAAAITILVLTSERNGRLKGKMNRLVMIPVSMTRINFFIVRAYLNNL